jgi:nucleotide-binding universal stress UspA family protein
MGRADAGHAPGTMSSRWIVGVEPDGNHDGPLHFAVSMQRRARPRLEVRGVYVLPTAEQVGEQARAHLDAHADAVCHAALVRTEARESLHEVETVDADAVDRGLEQAARAHEADALVIGRRAHRREIRFQRLGPVGRKLLRRLPTAVVVVPPDWMHVHDGPVVLATDLTEHSAEAAGFARELAQRLGTPLLVVHTSRRGDWAGPHFEGAAFQATGRRIREDATRGLESWAIEHGLADAVRVVHLGDPVSDIAGFAEAEQASLIVCGSRHLGTAARLFGHSVASELAAVADVPVAVVSR